MRTWVLYPIAIILLPVLMLFNTTLIAITYFILATKGFLGSVNGIKSIDLSDPGMDMDIILGELY